MKLGTRSILWGVHQAWLHPAAVYVAWVCVYRKWPSWREALSIFLHDIGYVGCGDIDGPEGSEHPEAGARIALKLMGPIEAELVRFHSRYTAEKYGREVSRICLPDKLSVYFYPTWLYTLLGSLSGEHEEYAERCGLTQHKRGILVHFFRVQTLEWTLRATIDPALRERVLTLFATAYTKSLVVMRSRKINPDLCATTRAARGGIPDEVINLIRPRYQILQRANSHERQPHVSKDDTRACDVERNPLSYIRLHTSVNTLITRPRKWSSTHVCSITCTQVRE